jgi:hypothetical protein
MKKYLVLFSLIAIIFLSWGGLGHRTVANIATDHLSPAAKSAVKTLLGKQTLADIASWADEVRNEPAYRKTGKEHFINVPDGLDRTAFDAQVKAGDNVYTALLKYEAVLSDSASSLPQQTEALKFIVHFVGDMHQPMHVSRSEDKGGNTIQVRYNNNGTNLHSLWDSKLLEHADLNDVQLADQCQSVPRTTVIQWQKETPLDWSWESYQISTKLYQAVAAPGGTNITDAYYQTYLPIIQQRIQQAGIRLAGILNTIFKNWKPGAVGKDTVTPLQDSATDSYCAKVYGGKFFSASDMTILNLGEAYPNQKMSVVIYGKDRSKWIEDPIKLYEGKRICVKGKQIEYQGKPEIVVADPAEIEIQ